MYILCSFDIISIALPKRNVAITRILVSLFLLNKSCIRKKKNILTLVSVVFIGLVASASSLFLVKSLFVMILLGGLPHN